MHLTGIKLLRKVVEVENREFVSPAADWDTEDWDEYAMLIKAKQSALVQQGSISFLCKHISEADQIEIKEECLLACISLLLGGNFDS